MTTDGLIAGVHFIPGDDPGAIAWKALAVNVSDLVAKGATPLAYVLSLALPGAPERAWLAAFAGGLQRAQAAFGCPLIGGDTDRTLGPLSVSITAFGTVPNGRMVRRSTAAVGDGVFVSGTIGDATLGLALVGNPALAQRCGLDAAAQAYLDARFRLPQPPVGLRAALLGHARAAMDISDGLVKDFDRLCRVSSVGGEIDATAVPLSAAARAVVAAGGATLGRPHHRRRGLRGARGDCATRGGEIRSCGSRRGNSRHAHRFYRRWRAGVARARRKWSRHGVHQNRLGSLWGLSPVHNLSRLRCNRMALRCHWCGRLALWDQPCRLCLAISSGQ